MRIVCHNLFDFNTKTINPAIWALYLYDGKALSLLPPDRVKYELIVLKPEQQFTYFCEFSVENKFGADHSYLTRILYYATPKPGQEGVIEVGTLFAAPTYFENSFTLPQALLSNIPTADGTRQAALAVARDYLRASNVPGLIQTFGLPMRCLVNAIEAIDGKSIGSVPVTPAVSRAPTPLMQPSLSSVNLSLSPSVGRTSTSEISSAATSPIRELAVAEDEPMPVDEEELAVAEEEPAVVEEELAVAEEEPAQEEPAQEEPAPAVAQEAATPAPAKNRPKRKPKNKKVSGGNQPRALTRSEEEALDEAIAEVQAVVAAQPPQSVQVLVPVQVPKPVRVPKPARVSKPIRVLEADPVRVPDKKQERLLQQKCDDGINWLYTSAKAAKSATQRRWNAIDPATWNRLEFRATLWALNRCIFALAEYNEMIDRDELWMNPRSRFTPGTFNCVFMMFAATRMYVYLVHKANALAEPRQAALDLVVQRSKTSGPSQRLR